MIRILSLALAVAMFTGCAAPLVNIPPLPGDVAFHSPNGKGVLAVQVTALRHVIQRWPPAGDAYAVVLPDGTTEESYRRIVGQLPEGTTTREQYGAELPTYEVAQVHISGTHARVDVVIPGPDGRPRLVSVFEAIDIGGWYARRSRLWNISVDEALRIVRASPPAAEPAEAPEE
jgi:hypothetical protein